ncbi:MAG: hypothetical protein ACJASX_004572 [Limisphaerales bacterium]|jgi:hypothetical protein
MRLPADLHPGSDCENGGFNARQLSVRLVLFAITAEEVTSGFSCAGHPQWSHVLRFVHGHHADQNRGTGNEW